MNPENINNTKNDHQIETLNKLAEIEISLHRLYSLFAKKFPEEKDFWLLIAQEETNHEKWIRKFMANISAGKVFFDEQRFNLVAIQSTIDFITIKEVQTENDEVELINALAYANDLESSVLEKEYYNVFSTDQVEFKELLDNLATATRTHRARVQQKLDQYRLQD